MQALQELCCWCVAVFSVCLFACACMTSVRADVADHWNGRTGGGDLYRLKESLRCRLNFGFASASEEGQ